MRIIAGVAGGRTLRGPQGTATRPMMDRVREALFSSLGDLSGMAVADLYAGSGSLGLEALSRGAGRAVFVERKSQKEVAEQFGYTYGSLRYLVSDFRKQRRNGQTAPFLP